MFENNEQVIKNFKKEYVANTVIIYFSDTELGNFETIHRSIRANTKFLKIGMGELEENFDLEDQRKNKYESSFLSWESNSKKIDEKIVPASKFFKDNIEKLKEILKNADFAIILYKSQDINMLSYVGELSYILHKYDVFSYHVVVENFVVGAKEAKLYNKLKKEALNYYQPIISISEETIIDAYHDATLINRKNFISKFALDLIESILVPFVEPKLNPNHFSIIKSLFYKESKSYLNKIIPTVGFSDSKTDWLDLSIIQALSNPLFYGSFNASNTFLVTIKSPNLTNKMIKRLEYILESIIGEDKKFLIFKYIGEFDIDIYSQITILALNVHEDKMILNPKLISEYSKKLIEEVQNSKHIFSEDTTKTLLLESSWDKTKTK